MRGRCGVRARVYYLENFSVFIRKNLQGNKSGNNSSKLLYILIGLAEHFKEKDGVCLCSIWFIVH